MKIAKCLLLPAVTCLLSVTLGCQQSPLGTSDRQVRHVVIGWLKPDADKQAIMVAAKQLSELPSVVDYSAGYKLPSDQPGADASFDVAIVFTLESPEALQRFTAHPTHQQLLRDVLQPNLAKYTVYDATMERYELGEATNEATRQRRAAAMQNQRDVIDRRK